MKTRWTLRYTRKLNGRYEWSLLFYHHISLLAEPLLEITDDTEYNSQEEAREAAQAAAKQHDINFAKS